MSVLEFPLKRYQFTIVVFILLCAIGIASVVNIPRQEDPVFPVSSFTITVTSPGAEPKDMEQLIAKPIEDRLTELDDVKRIDSSIEDSGAMILIDFFTTIDPEKKYDEIVREVNALRPDLPAEISQLDVHKVHPGLVNIVQYALISDDAPYAELEDYARQLKDVLKGVSGIRSAESWAYPARELRIALDLRRMATLKLTAEQVVQALQSENATIPGGTVDVGSRSFSLKTSGGYQSLDEVRNTVVAANGYGIVRVRDIAEVSWNTQQINYLGRFNGRRAVFVTANQKDGYNIFDTRARITTAVELYKKSLPKRIDLRLGFDQSGNVATRLNRLTWDFSAAIALVLLFLLPLGLRAASVVMVSIPLSLAIGISVLYFGGFSLNQISITGFVVSLGLLVDDSIVVVENITRYVREGYARAQAAVLATRQIAPAVIGCTAVLMFAFLPLMLLAGDAGKFIRVLPIAVLATIGASLLVSLTLIPFIASRVLHEGGSPHGNKALQWVTGAVHIVYRPLLRKALSSPKKTVAISLLISIAVVLPVVYWIGFSLFPKAETPYFTVAIRTPAGSSLDETDRALRFAESQVRLMPELESYCANLGHGNPRVYYNILPREEAVNYAELLVKLKSYNARKTPRLLDELRTRLTHYANARISVNEFENGTTISAPVSIRVIGADLDVLYRLSAQVEKTISATPGISDVVNPVRIARTNLQLKTNLQKAALLGVPAIAIDRAVRLSVAGLPVGKYKERNGEQYDIVVRTPIENRADLNTLNAVRVASASGTELPLNQLAQLEFSAAPTEIHRYNRQRAVVIDAQVKNGYNTAKVTAAVLQRLDNMSWPRGYSYLPGGELESRNESFGGLGVALIVAILGIVAILVLEFGSFKSTLIVLTVVPFGAVGGILMLALSGNSISFTATIGFIALIGMEIKNSLLLVDFTNRLRERGVELDQAIETAGEIRFVPILLTSATAIGGLLPLAVQNNGMYSPMAWVIIGGLIASTLIARIVTPAVYKLLPPAIDVKQVDEENSPRR